MQQTWTIGSALPSFYDGRRTKDEGKDAKVMDNSSGALKYYTPQTRSNITPSDGTLSGVHKWHQRIRGLGANHQREDMTQKLRDK